MITRCLLVGMVFVLFQACSNRAPTPSTAGVPQKSPPQAMAVELAARQAVETIRAPTTRRLDIFAMPLGQPLAPLTPELLERGREYTIGVEWLPFSKWREDLISALGTSSVRSVEAEPPDCRWGLVFYDDGGQCVLTMYLNLSGDQGLINGTRVVLDDKVVRVLQRRCGPLWQ
jgi:hypothetical protein